MKKRLLTLTGAVLMFCLISAPVFGATVEGTGMLVARGNGLVRIEGDGHINASGAGVLTIKDNAGDAKITVTRRGHKKVLEDGTIVYVGFNGHANVRGSAVVLTLKAKDIKLEARGTGQATLRGKGTYRVKGTEGKWTEAGVVIGF